MRSRRVGDVCSREVHRLGPEASVRAAAELMARHHIGAVLVMEGSELRGIFTERDLLNRVVAVGGDPAATRLDSVMTPAPRRVGPDLAAVEALRLMREGRFRHLPVGETSEGNGRIIGVLSLRDFIGAELAEVDAQLDFASKIAEGS